MKQQVLKALANPPRIFFVPYSLAVLNFVLQFVIFIAVYVVFLLIFNIEVPPILFLCSVIVVHMILAVYSKQDPQIGQILTAKIQLFKRRIPRRLAA